MILQNWGSPDVVTESFLRMTTVRSGCTEIVLHVSTDPGSFCCGMEKWTTVRGSPNPCNFFPSQRLGEHEPNRFFCSYKKYVSEAIQSISPKIWCLGPVSAQFLQIPISWWLPCKAESAWGASADVKKVVATVSAGVNGTMCSAYPACVDVGIKDRELADVWKKRMEQQYRGH